jgi:hypothetical protein
LRTGAGRLALNIILAGYKFNREAFYERAGKAATARLKFGLQPDSVDFEKAVFRSNCLSNSFRAGARAYHRHGGLLLYREVHSAARWSTPFV